jgi:lipoprotein-anchoring transpeptidase ErfK/SrfK
MLSGVRSILFMTIAGLWLGFGATVAQATVNVVIDLSRQTMTVEAEDAAISYTWKVSTAKSGYRTPLGTFKPQWLARMHYSTLYDSSPMPYSIFFKGNFAIHGTEYVKRLGRPASHGCIRLAPENAKVLFYLVKGVGKENVTIRIIP